MPAKQSQARANIVDTARDLFYHQGYSATSYADISKQTGLGKGNIHYHFKSKDNILKAVAEQRTEAVRALLEEWTLDCGTPYDCIERFITMVEDNAEDLAKYGCPMGTLNDELGKNNPDLQMIARKMFDLFLRWLEARFRAIVAPEVAREHAEHLMILAQGTSILAHSYRNPDLVHRHSKTMRAWLEKVCVTSS